MNFTQEIYYTYVAKVIVEVYISSTEVSAEEGGMGGEDGGDREFPQSTEEESNPHQPLVEVGHNHWRRTWQAGQKLWG